MITVILMVVNALGAIRKSLKGLEIGFWVLTIHSRALLESARILRSVPDIWGYLVSLRLNEKTLPALCKQLARCILLLLLLILLIIIIMIIITITKKGTCQIVNFPVPTDTSKSERKWKEGSSGDLKKKIWNMKLKIIPILTGTFGTVTKGLLKGLEDLEIAGRRETIQTNVVLTKARILRRALITWGDLLSLKLKWRIISQRWCEKF